MVLHAYAFDDLIPAIKHKGKCQESNDDTNTNKSIRFYLFLALHQGKSVTDCGGFIGRVVFEESHALASNTDDLRHLHSIAKGVVQ